MTETDSRPTTRPDPTEHTDEVLEALDTVLVDDVDPASVPPRGGLSFARQYTAAATTQAAALEGYLAEDLRDDLTTALSTDSYVEARDSMKRAYNRVGHALTEASLGADAEVRLMRSRDLLETGLEFLTDDVDRDDRS